MMKKNISDELMERAKQNFLLRQQEETKKEKVDNPIFLIPPFF